MNKTKKQKPRPLFEIAEEIEENWQNQSKVHARPYIKAMTWLQTMDDHYFHESAEEIVLRFLANAQTWRGETARRIKAELKAMLPKRK